MTKHPAQTDRGAQGNEQKDDSWGKVKDFLLSNPTLILTLLYLYITAVGIIYSAVLYRRFGINIFDYSETADFLLAAFKNPVAFLSAGLLGAMGAAVGGSMAAEWRAWDTGRMQPEGLTREEIENLGEQRKERLRKRMAALAIGISLVSIFSSLVFPYYSASKTASTIKDGENPAVDVRYRSFSGTAGQVTKPRLELIGATQKAVFFYDVDDERTLVIPQSQIVSIEVPE